MSSKEKISWIACPECGSKIGVILSVGKVSRILDHEKEGEWPPEQVMDIRGKLEEAGVDLSLVEIEETEEMVHVTPIEFLGDRWAPINDAMRGLKGNWIRAGRNSHWEIPKE